MENRAFDILRPMSIYKYEYILLGHFFVATAFAKRLTSEEVNILRQITQYTLSMDEYVIDGRIAFEIINKSYILHVHFFIHTKSAYKKKLNFFVCLNS